MKRFAGLLILCILLAHSVYSATAYPSINWNNVPKTLSGLTATAGTLGSAEKPLITSVSGSVDVNGSSLGARVMDGNGNIIGSEQVHSEGRGLYVVNTEQSNSGDTLGYDTIGGRWSKPVFLPNAGGYPMGHPLYPFFVDATGSTTSVWLHSGTGDAITSTDISGEERLNVHATQSGTWNVDVDNTTFTVFFNPSMQTEATSPLKTTTLADASVTAFFKVAIIGLMEDVYYSITSTASVLSTWASGFTQDDNAFIVQDRGHEYVHDGASKYFINTDTDVDTAVTKNWLMINEDNEFHLTTLNITSATAGYFYMYESPTVTNNGSALTWVNNNFNSSSTTEMTAYYDSTTTSAGTVKINKHYIPASSGGSVRVGGSFNTRNEIILKPLTPYLFVFETKADNNEATIEVMGYEK